MKRDTDVRDTDFQEFSMNGNHHHAPPPPPPPLDAALYSNVNHHPYHSNTSSFSAGNQPYHSNTASYSNGNQPYHSNTAPYSNGNHSYHSNTASFSNGNHQPNSSFLGVGNEPGFGLNYLNNDYLAAGNQFPNPKNLAPMNGGTNHYTDNLLESFSGLSLNNMPAIRQPSPYVAAPPSYDPGNSSYLERYYSAFNDGYGVNGGVSFGQAAQLRDIGQMRVQSAARGHAGGLYMPPHLENYFDDLSYMPIQQRNLNGYGYNKQSQQHFRSSSYDDYGMGSSWLNSSRSFPYRSASADRINNSPQADWRNGGSISSRPRQRAIASFTSLKDLRGKIYAVSKDQHGCRFLQTKFEEGNPEEIQMIFMEVKDHICDLMVDQFGNYLVQKFFAACNQEQITQLLLLVINDEEGFMEICNDSHGTRSVQKLLEYLTTAEQRARVIAVLRRITVPLTKNLNGHHVIQYCLKHFSREDNKLLLNVVADNCMEIALDKSGCCVIQQCVEHAVGEPRDRLISEITSNAIILSEHPYGNYVVQYILGLKIRQATADIMAELSGNLVSLAMSKYGSNVIEKFLKCEPEEGYVVPIVEEIMYSPNFLRVLQDPFGNYVAQSALRATKGTMRNALASMVMENYANLHSHPHGKRVLAYIKGHKIRV